MQRPLLVKGKESTTFGLPLTYEVQFCNNKKQPTFKKQYGKTFHITPRFSPELNDVLQQILNILNEESKKMEAQASRFVKIVSLVAAILAICGIGFFEQPVKGIIMVVICFVAAVIFAHWVAKNKWVNRLYTKNAV